MTKLDINKFAALAVIVALALMTVIFGYKLEIGPSGLRLDAATRSVIQPSLIQEQ